LAIPLVTDNRNHVVCLNHFSCHEFGLDDMSVTTAGKAILSHILNSICEEFIDYNNQVIDDQVIRSEANLNLLYITHMGIKRNIITENYYLRNNVIPKSGIITISDSDFNDIVTGKRYPILRDYWLVLYEWKKVYMIYNGSTYYLGYKKELNENCLKQKVLNLYMPEIIDDLDVNLLPQNSNAYDLLRILDIVQVTTINDNNCNIHFDIHQNGTKSITSNSLECSWILSSKDFDSIPYADEIQYNITMKAREQGGYFSEGTLIQNGVNPAIYIYQNYTVYLIPNIQTFMALGRDFSEVKRIHPSCFNKLGETKELPSV